MDSCNQLRLLIEIFIFTNNTNVCDENSFRKNLQFTNLLQIKNKGVNIIYTHILQFTNLLQIKNSDINVFCTHTFRVVEILVLVFHVLGSICF